MLIIESTVNIPDDFSSIVTDASDKSIDVNEIFLSLNFCISSFVSSVLISTILSLYIHSNLFLLWNFNFIIKSPLSPVYVLFIASSGFFFASFTEYIFMLDTTLAPEVSISPTAKYLLSLDIDAVEALVVENSVLNNNSP